MLVSSQELELGQFVKSRAGRDKGKILIVTGVVDDQYVLVSDGDLRKLDKPKKKKVMHLTKLNQMDPSIKEAIQNDSNLNNAMLRKIIKENNIKSNEEGCIHGKK